MKVIRTRVIWGLKQYERHKEEKNVIHQVLEPLESMAYTRNTGVEDLASNITVQFTQLQRGMETQGQVNLDQGRRIAGRPEGANCYNKKLSVCVREFHVPALSIKSYNAY